MRTRPGLGPGTSAQHLDDRFGGTSSHSSAIQYFQYPPPFLLIWSLYPPLAHPDTAHRCQNLSVLMALRTQTNYTGIAISTHRCWQHFYDLLAPCPETLDDGILCPHAYRVHNNNPSLYSTVPGCAAFNIGDIRFSQADPHSSVQVSRQHYSKKLRFGTEKTYWRTKQLDGLMK